MLATEVTTPKLRKMTKGGKKRGQVRRRRIDKIDKIDEALDR
jgi:hypothetical protein